jgi:hypothetical protein
MYMLGPDPSQGRAPRALALSVFSRFFFQGSSEEDSPALALDTAETERSGLGESTTTFSQIDQRFDCPCAI